MGKSVLKHRGWKRILTLVLALAMLAAYLPAGVARAADEAADSNVHVLEANTLAAFDKGDKADGETEIVADYFTVIYSANSKNDGSDKTWDDGYTSGQRINFGGKAETTKNSIKFTTSNPATVKIWWASNERSMAILDSNGEIVAKTEEENVKNKAYLSTLELDGAGTYFLGGDTGSNYIFKVEVEESAADKVSVLEANTLAAFDKGDKADGEIETVADYFTVIYSANSKNDGSDKTWEDGYTSGQRINFGGKATTEKNSVKFTTSGPATVRIWWVQGGDDNREMGILNSSGEVVVQTSGTYVKNDPYMSILELAEAGTYFLGGISNNNYIFKIEVTETVGEKAPRADWAEVAAPEITSVAGDAEKPDSVVVTVSGEIGYDAADQITVIMRDEDGWELKRLNSLAEKSEHKLTFAPSGTGTYKFEVFAIREDETVIHKGAEVKSVSFTYPLGVPVMKYAVNDGKGGLTVEWNSVKEATGYIVTAGGKTVTTTGLNATKAVVEGLQAGDEVEVTVAAVRGAETGDACAPIKVTVSDEAGIAWVFSAFGTSTNTTDNGFEKNEDGSVRVYSVNGKGKVQPASEDGLAFYYTALDPNTTNFVFTATANVNSWTYSNGQEGFGLLVMDQVGVNGSVAPVWSNSFMAGVSGLSGVGVNMKLGVGALARTGVTEYSATKPDSYSSAWTLLDFSGVDTEIRNLVGNCTNPDKVPGETIDPALTSFKLAIVKDDEGYHVSYTDHLGETHTADYNDPKALSYVDDYIYVGMFAARNMDVTFTDIELTVSPASGSTSTPGTGETEEQTAAPSYSFANPSVSNQKKFDLDIRVNVDGKAVVTDAAGNELYKGVVKAGEKNPVTVTLAEGANAFTAVVTPDENALTADGAKLTSYEQATITTTVNMSVDERAEIYVAPNGRDDAKGTADDPTTLAAAVKNPAPGTVIILMEGTYHYTSGVTIERGINGTADKPITIKADPAAATRPVLDWEGKGNGLRLNADWWVLCGFDSTRSTAKGVHVGGNHNLVERVNVYRNSNTGLSISRINFGSSIPDWPSYNTIRNCSAWLNADPGYEDADGFEAKLTVGVGNVFDGCIAAYNADDGWDLYARSDVIAPVTIKNSIAFKNGWDIIDGKEVNAGNGNGFKLGGGNIPVDQKIINSVAFANKADGFTSNSNPNVKVENCISFDNGGYNLTLYTNIASLDTAFEVTGFISFMGSKDDRIKAQGAQSKTDYLKDNNYYQGHTSGEPVAEDWFVHLDTDTAIGNRELGIARNEDGSINMNGFLALTNKAPTDAGARLSAAEWLDLFADVSEDDWFGGDVAFAVQNGLMVGVSDGKFNPGGTATRGMLMTVLARIDGVDTSGSKPWYQAGVEWAMQAGVSDGAKPVAGVTREQAVTMLYRYAGGIAADGDLSAYPDADNVSGWAESAMIWAVQNGIIQGTGSKLNPKGIASRAEAAAMLARFCQNIVK